MALSYLVMLSLSAAPAVDSQWTWAFDDTRSMKVTGAPAGSHVTVSPHLEKTQLDIKIIEAGEAAPKKFKVTVKTGPATLRSHVYEVESNYGEAVLKDVTPEGSRATYKLSEIYAAGVAQDINPGGDLGVLRRTLGTLLRPDPVIEAAKAGPPCTEATNAALVKAVAQFTASVMLNRAGDETVKDASATCVGTDGTKYTVRFTLRFPLRDDGVDFPFSGTVTLPANAWHAAFDLKGQLATELKNSAKTPMIIKGTMSLRSALTKK